MLSLSSFIRFIIEQSDYGQFAEEKNQGDRYLIHLKYLNLRFHNKVRVVGEGRSKKTLVGNVTFSFFAYLYK